MLLLPLLRQITRPRENAFIEHGTHIRWPWLRDFMRAVKATHVPVLPILRRGTTKVLRELLDEKRTGVQTRREIPGPRAQEQSQDQETASRSCAHQQRTRTKHQGPTPVP